MLWYLFKSWEKKHPHIGELKYTQSINIEFFVGVNQNVVPLFQGKNYFGLFMLAHFGSF